MSSNANRVKANQSSIIALTTIVAGTVTPSPAILAPGDSQRIGACALYMRVSAGITTSTIVVTTLWQGSDDGVNWDIIYPGNGAAYVNVAAAGNGGLVTTVYRQWFDFGDAAACQYIRAAVKNTVATGGAGDNITISYGWMRRFFIAP